MRPEGTARAFWLRWRSSGAFKVGVLAVGLCPALFVFTLAWSAAPGRLDVALGIGVLTELVTPFFLSRTLASLAKRGERVLSIDADGITTETTSGEWHATWADVREVVSTPEFTFLLGAGIHSVAIPAEAFEDESQRDEFVRRANRYMSPGSREMTSS
jgi:hypothetical protein